MEPYNLGTLSPYIKTFWEKKILKLANFTGCTGHNMWKLVIFSKMKLLQKFLPTCRWSCPTSKIFWDQKLYISMIYQKHFQPQTSNIDGAMPMCNFVIKNPTNFFKIFKFIPQLFKILTAHNFMSSKAFSALRWLKDI